MDELDDNELDNELDLDLDGDLAGVAQRDPQDPLVDGWHPDPDWEERICLRVRGLDIF